MSSDQIDYDALPYASLPFPQTQPARIAALASLHGCRPPNVETATVLELGCASGGNLIPLAARFPEARFDGVDLADRHIREGRGMLAALGLQNITLEQDDIAELKLDGRQYDYIICHGVFSWTPAPVQNAILRICAETLSDDGLAYVSYNALPGWSLRQAVREICRRHSYLCKDPIEIIAEARKLLEAYAKCLETKSPYGAALHAEIVQCLRMTDPHFQGEFLGPFNEPFHFCDFVERSEAHGLSYVCDAAPPEQGSVSIEPLLGGDQPVIPVEDRVARNQAADIVSGRTFRRSVLRKSSSQSVAEAGSGALQSLHFACSMIREGEESGALTFFHGQSRIKTNDPVAGRALSLLAEAYPETRTLDQIAGAAMGSATLLKADAGKRLHETLLRTIESGHVTVSTVPFRCADIQDDRPAIWPVARTQLAEGLIEVSSRLHEPVALRGPVRFIADMMDGTRTRQALADEICAAVDEGRLTLDGQSAAQGASADHAQLTAALNHFVRECRRSGLIAEASSETAP